MTPEPAAPNQPYDVAIGGGGISRLATAYYLQRHATQAIRPFRYTLIEHSPTVGGKIVTEQVHGYGDTTVAVEQSLRLAERLRALGRPVELRLYDGMEHYLDASRPDPGNADLLARTLAFFRRHLDG